MLIKGGRTPRSVTASTARSFVSGSSAPALVRTDATHLAQTMRGSVNVAKPFPARATPIRNCAKTAGRWVAFFFRFARLPHKGQVKIKRPPGQRHLWESRFARRDRCVDAVRQEWSRRELATPAQRDAIGAAGF